MKRRIIEILLGCILLFTLTSCNSNKIITLSGTETSTEVADDGTYNNVLLYKTEKVEQYLAFLESFDESNNEILGITTCMYTGPYTSNGFYMVTYKKLDEPREVRATGKVSLFKTKSEEEYRTFLANFDENLNEILGITTSMYTGAYTNGAFYMVTFRELK